MLFNSFIFLFAFLPVTLGLTFALGRWRQNAARLALTLLSLGFYAWWKPVHLPLLLGSILFNFFVGGLIQRAFAEKRHLAVKAWLIFGLAVDIALLGWFKYANFVVDNVNTLFGTTIGLHRIALPLAISFFTFQKIAYLIDSARGDARRIGALDFALFAAFFPQLIAGPIVHYKEVVPQFERRLWGRLSWRNIMVGLVILAIGLFKKTVIADTLAGYANPLYDGASSGNGFNLLSGWLAAVTFTLQVYFDFSGYSDMAIGLARMFGIKLPLNFHSPLRATSILDYWRRWHMTLQRFITAYVFQPLSVPLNRKAAELGLTGWSAFGLAIALPTFITFVIVGIWHGAGWTYVLFGVLNALYICTNEVWRERRKNRRRALRRKGLVLAEPGRWAQVGYYLLTLLAVIVSDVVFRAASVADAVSIWQGMIGFGSAPLATPVPGRGAGLALTLLVSMFVVMFTPNTQQIMRRFDPAYNWVDWKDAAPAAFSWTWKPNAAGLAFAGAALFLGIMFIQRGQAIFLYFNF